MRVLLYIFAFLTALFLVADFVISGIKPADECPKCILLALFFSRICTVVCIITLAVLWLIDIHW